MDNFMNAYSIKQVSERTGITVGTLRQWEKDFEGILQIPRDKQNYRYYTDLEIDTLERIKVLRDKDLSIQTIREMFKERPPGDIENQHQQLQPSVPQMKQNEVIETLKNIQTTLEEFPEIKQMIVSQVKSELVEEVKNEVAASLEDSNKKVVEEVENANKEVMKKLEEISVSHKNEINRRDELFMENLKLMRELKEEKQKNKEAGIIKRFVAAFKGE